MDANGAYWRRYGDSLSMCPVSTDNEPLAEPVTVYLPVSALGRFLFDYEMDRLPPGERIAWNDLEDWKREAWQREASDYVPNNGEEPH